MEELISIVERNGLPESFHYGSIAVVNAEGQILYQVGNPLETVFVRSAIKPVQTIPLITSGASERFLFSEREIAVSCGSHNAEKVHVDTVQSMLFRIGLDESHLRCGPHPPYDPEAYESLLLAGQKPTAIHNNCSGKHAAMLALALHLQSDIVTYDRLHHPVQQKVVEIIADLADIEERDLKTGVDGCGIPTFYMPLYKLAFMFAKLSNSSSIEDEHTKHAVDIITKAMTKFPEMVGGKDVLCTDVMQAMNGKVIAKAGAEGMYTMGIMNEGIGVAVKVVDGNARAAWPAAVEVLKQLNLLSDAEQNRLSNYLSPSLKNRRGDIVGKIESTFKLKKV
ncbi:asparaginase [Bacillus sp. HMF5848]|uniref:asparaginase n=1 Tax=Bacillus sp. HMF5848 TaxID=2495421 RepID=UPI000F794A8F|nr:asparaginase [Bacillus sp. HMF5848]RSK27180.1 asparaginase [Bacillus sp. HMF5848]